MITYRHLNESDFEQLHKTMLAAFSDYVVEYQPTQEILRRMFLIENVRFDLSVGVFDDEKMVGFTLNGSGEWQNKKTVYDAGTGVIAAYRRRGLSRRMFEFLLPVLREKNFEQYLLEVITINEPALRLYQNLGFETRRELGVFMQKEVSPFDYSSPGVELKELETLEWERLESFWSYYPSWQNSIEAMKRSFADDSIVKTPLGLFFEGNLAGYGIVFHRSGNVPQLAIAEEYRGNGFGRVLLSALGEKCDKPLFISNVDTDAKEVVALLQANNFFFLTSQYEMLLEL